MRVKQPEIIYEDEAIIVCRKEAGVAVQTARAGQADMVSLLKNYRAKKKEEPYIGLIHRLDQPVEGVMVFAKTKQAAAKLSVQVSSRSMEKEYLAVTEGIPQPSEGELCDWLLRNGRTNTSQVVEPGTPQAKDAKLRYQVEQTDEEQQKALVHIWLHTGRHHQIRVQFAHAGYPLMGDTKYGREAVAGRYCSVALCSCRIAFRDGIYDPAQGKRVYADGVKSNMKYGRKTCILPVLYCMIKNTKHVKNMCHRGMKNGDQKCYDFTEDRSGRLIY